MQVVSFLVTVNLFVYYYFIKTEVVSTTNIEVKYIHSDTVILINSYHEICFIISSPKLHVQKYNTGDRPMYVWLF